MWTIVIFLILILKTKLQNIAGVKTVQVKRVTLLLFRGYTRFDP